MLAVSKYYIKKCYKKYQQFMWYKLKIVSLIFCLVSCFAVGTFYPYSHHHLRARFVTKMWVIFLMDEST